MLVFLICCLDTLLKKKKKPFLNFKKTLVKTFLGLFFTIYSNSRSSYNKIKNCITRQNLLGTTSIFFFTFKLLVFIFQKRNSFAITNHSNSYLLISKRSEI